MKKIAFALAIGTSLLYVAACKPVDKRPHPQGTVTIVYTTDNPCSRGGPCH